MFLLLFGGIRIGVAHAYNPWLLRCSLLAHYAVAELGVLLLLLLVAIGMKATLAHTALLQLLH